LVEAVIVIACSLPVPRSFADDVHDAVGVDVERHFDLRNAARSGRDALEPEASERLVVASHLALALEIVDVDRRLAVFGRREDCDFLVGIVVLRSISA
jgi:hypothetical protein